MSEQLNWTELNWTEWYWWWCSVAQSCLTLCHPMDCSKPGPSVLLNSQSLLKFMTIEFVMLSNHLILYHPLLFFLQSVPDQGLSRVAKGGQSIGASASASVLPTNTQDWLPLVLTDILAVQRTSSYAYIYEVTAVYSQVQKPLY